CPRPVRRLRRPVSALTNHGRLPDSRDLCMKHPVARALLIVAGLLVVALAMNLFAGPTRGLALSSAGLMGLLVYRVMRARHEHVLHALPECLPDHTAQAPWLEPQL